ncbi:MBL fold metallo-hydrolase [uncultured Arthrobacter sp.]|uniref:MBL fold metallo-hydrolase n=1 Tax=uncultured Arthrobacter sp. TaxID=114050 RepID=UPI0032164ABE
MSTQQIELTVLGSSTPFPSRENPCSGYLVSSESTKIWVDAGTGTLGPLQNHANLTDLDAIWISHLHADHSADLLTAFYALVFANIRRAAPLPLYGPPGIAERLGDYLTNGTTRAPIASAFKVHELHDGHVAQVGHLRLTTRAVAHGIPAFGVRIATSAATLVFSGDTAPCANLAELAMDCDALLCESESTAPPRDQLQVHHTPEDAGRTATAANAGRLIVTHVGRFLSPYEATRRAQTEYAGHIEYASPGAVFTIGGGQTHDRAMDAPSQCE